MKKSVALFCAALFTVLVCGTGFAGEKKSHNQGPEKRIERLDKELSLTPEQKIQVEAIFKENREKHKAEMEKMREAMKAEKAETDQKIQSVLTPEQSEKFAKMQEARKAKMEKKMEKMGKKMKDGSCKGDKCPCPGMDCK